MDWVDKWNQIGDQHCLRIDARDHENANYEAINIQWAGERAENAVEYH